MGLALPFPLPNPHELGVAATWDKDLGRRSVLLAGSRGFASRASGLLPPSHRLVRKSFLVCLGYVRLSPETSVFQLCFWSF